MRGCSLIIVCLVIAKVAHGGPLGTDEQLSQLNKLTVGVKKDDLYRALLAIEKEHEKVEEHTEEPKNEVLLPVVKSHKDETHAKGNKTETERDIVEAKENTNLIDLLESNIAKPNSGTEAEQGVEKRILPALVLGIFGAVMGTANLLNGLIGGALSRQTLSEIKEKLNVIEQKVDAISGDIQNLLKGQSHLSNTVRYSDDVQRLEYLLHFFQREISFDDASGVFVPSIVAVEFAAEVLSLSSDGIDEVLLNINTMILGNSVLSPDSIFITYEAMLNKDSDSYLAQFTQFAEYTLSIQAAGNALWINALKIQGRNTTGIQQLQARRIAEQNAFLGDVGANWPEGSYGLPSPSSGCPAQLGFNWIAGHRRHDSEDNNNNNAWSNSNHFTETGVNWIQDFCIKEGGGVGSWPSGDYCILVYPRDCPNGFSCGWIFWDDEDTNNRNWVAGVLPLGEYGRNTKIYYACRSDGSVNDEILLPASEPFYLYRYHDSCQKVKNMDVSMEWFYFDNEDSGNIDETVAPHPYEDGGANNHRLYYCYYTPILFTV